MTDSPTLAGSIAEAVRTEMTRRDKTGTEVAKAMGVSHMYLSRRLNGEVEFRASDLEDIAEFLGVPVTTFLPTPERAA